VRCVFRKFLILIYIILLLLLLLGEKRGLFQRSGYFAKGNLNRFLVLGCGMDSDFLQ
jgi:hypothetical protein